MKDLVFTTEETYLRRHDDRRARERRGVLTFVVGGEVYGVEILSIREIIKLREITEVPRAPRFLLGVVTVRGLVLPVVDLRLRLRLDAHALSRNARILVVMHKSERFGLLVDEVRGVVRFADEQIEPVPASLAPSEAPFLSGIGRYPDEGQERMVILLSLDAVLGFEVGRR
ncbi:MAG: scaffold protein CheW associated with MCPs of class [bacterium]|nr:scaffold protein CheW associated with MCPs of class [bacterium]